MYSTPTIWLKIEEKKQCWLGWAGYLWFTYYLCSLPQFPQTDWCESRFLKSAVWDKLTWGAPGRVAASWPPHCCRFYRRRGCSSLRSSPAHFQGLGWAPGRCPPRISRAGCLQIGWKPLLEYNDIMVIQTPECMHTTFFWNFVLTLTTMCKWDTAFC